MLIALDDTDSPTGGCTTHTALALVARMGWHLRGMPRLVRLNPNCPHKTRGNGAVVLDIVAPTGPRVPVGSWGDQPIYAFPDGEAVDFDIASAWAALQDLAEPDASPAIAGVAEPLPELVYWQGVTTEITRDAAIAVLNASGAIHFGAGRGVIGCAAALAWPGPAASYELIAYRQERRWGTPRLVAAEPLLGLEAITFHTSDGPRLACVPNTPCPVLLGLRGHDPEHLVDLALPTARQASSEPIAGWAIWASNQASGDHVTEIPDLAQAPTWSTIRAPLTITGAPVAKAGGHVHVAATDETGSSTTMIAFEPTGGFRANIESLRSGDKVVATGALVEGNVQLESLRLISPVAQKVANPVCCEKSMKSKGRNGGFRCSFCNNTQPQENATFSERQPAAWEVPVMARRHLHRPLDWN